MVVNVSDNAIITYDQDGAVIQIEHSVEGGTDGIVITADGTKYASSVRYGSVSRIRPGQEAEVIASGIPSAASMCYDSTQNQLVIPLNSNYALAFVRLIVRIRTVKLTKTGLINPQDDGLVSFCGRRITVCCERGP